MYINTTNGTEVSVEEMQQYATEAGMGIEEYAAAAGFTLKSDENKTTDFPTSTAADADVVQQKETASKNTDLPAVDTSSDSSDPLDDYYVTIEDLRQDEEDASPALNIKLAGIGISTKQSTSFGSLDALNFENSIDPKVEGEGAGTKFFNKFIGDPTKIFSAIGIGTNKTDEELAAAAAEINEYIKLKADTSFLNKAKKRSGDDYEKYADTLKAPELSTEDLESSMKKDLVSKFSKIQRSEVSDEFDGFQKFSGEGIVVGTKQKDATVDQFKNEKEFKAYNQWKKDGYISDFSEDEILLYDDERKQKYALDASLRYASDLSIDGRMDVLALAANDEKKLNNFQEISSDYFKIEDSLKNAIKEYNLNPTQDKLIAANAIKIDYLQKQGEIQSLQGKLKKDGVFEKGRTIPLALTDLNKDYDYVRQLRTGFKSLAGNITYGGVSLAILAGKLQNPGAIAIELSSPESTSAKIESATGLVSLGDELQKESENFQRSIAVDEIRSVSDAGKWVAGSAVNLVPSLAMAMTGPAAMPLFFLSGMGSKGMEMAVSRKNSSQRMIKNKQFLIDNPNADAFTVMSLEKEMAEDAKILGIKEWQSLGIQALYGIAEVAMEKVGTMTLLKNLKNATKMLSPTTVKEGFKFLGKGLKEIGKGIRVEGGSEFGTTVAQNFGDIFILGEDKNLFEGGLESFAQGALMGGAMNSVGVAKGIRQGYVSVLASRDESAKLKENLNALRKLTNQPEIQSWEDLKNLKLKLPKETQSVVDAITLDMQKTEEGVMFKLGSTLSIDQAYKVEEANRKMRLLNKQLIEASTNPSIKAAELTQIKSQLSIQFDALAKEREQLLSDSVDIKQTKESFVNANVSLDSTLGYEYYSQSMLNESVKSVIGNYSNLSPEANQAGLDAAKKALIKEGSKNPSIKEIKDKALKEYIDNTYKKKIESGRSNAEAFAKQQGLDLEIMSFEGEGADAQTIKAFEDAGVTGSELAKLKKAVKAGTFEGGAIGGTNKIIINMNAAVENKRIGVFAHEVLHKYAKEKYGSNQDAINKAGEDLLSYLEKNDKNIFAKVKFRIDTSYTNKNKDGDVVKEADYYEEAMNAMSDVLADGQVVNDKSMNKIRVFANSFLSKLPGKFQFTVDQGRDAYEFVKGYNKAAHFGGVKTPDNPIVKSTDDNEKAITREDKDKKVSLSVSKKQLTPEQDKELRADVLKIKKLASENEALAKKYKNYKKDSKGNILKDKKGKPILVIELSPKQTRLENKVRKEIKPIVDRVVTDRTKALYDPIAVDAKKGVSRQMFQESMRSDIESMVFNEFEDLQSLEKFIVNRAYFRVNSLAKDLGIKSVEEGITKGLEAAEKVAVEETTAPKADKPKYRNILKSNVLPTETVNTIKDKVLKTVRTLKSKLDTKVSKNKTVTPLIAEIKKNMGKQADIDFKKAMGGKKDGQIKRFLIKNKKAVLENMTTTWLMGAMPGAVQKQVNGSFTSDWQGKKIDREKTSTQQAGRTSGAEIVRRLPNAFKNLDDKTYLSYIIDESGAPIRGRKESLAKAMAEELSFDIFTAELQNENSDIRKAFEGNQEALGVVLADNLVQEITRDAERGTVKFSKTFINKSPELITEYLKGIRSEGFKNTFLTLVDEGSKNPLKDTLIEYFTDFPGLTKKEVATAAVEFSKDYTFNKKEVGVTRVVKLESKEATLDYVIEQISGNIIRGTNYGDVQSMLEGSISKLDLKTLKDLNKGRRALKKLAYELVERGFSGNQVFTMLSYSYGPSGLGGFKGVKNQSGKGRVTPKKSILTKSELGPVNYDKNGAVENRGALVLSKDDFIQNFLPDNAKKDGKPTGETIAISNKVAKKDFYTDAKSVWNRLTDLNKKKEARELWELGKGYGENLVEIIKAIESLDITSATRRELVTGLFASMSAAGKIPSTVRFYPSRMDGTLLTFAELVKLFGRKDGVVDQGVFEHTKPANRIAIASYIYSITGLKSDLDILEKELLDYDTAMITMGMDIGLRKLKLQSLMGLNYKPGDGVMGTRYAELITTMEAEDITFWDAKTGEVISSAGVFGKQLNQEMEVGLKPVKTEQKAIDNGRSVSWSKSPKKIRVFDFDDTLARTKSNVLYTMPDGTKGKINAATFAKDAGKMEADGAIFDFIEFSKVMDGKKGPLFEVAKKIADARGTEDVFVLTARPQDAAGSIQEFLKSLGLSIPLKNITGLGDGNAKAKADWMIGKVAEGYNDFYFADDAIKNVKAVKDVFDTFDIKGKVQQAKVKFSKGLDKGFNDMIERQTGTESFKEFSKGVAQRRGKKVGKFKIFVSPSAEDFRGLTQYKFAGKGKQGEADQKFFEEALMDPYFKGVAAVESARETIKNDTKALFKMFKPVKKKLNKLVPGIDFTYDGAVRVYLWNKAGIEIPGLTKRDNKKLNDAIANDPELSAFADALLLVSKQDTWPAPTEYWEAKTTLSDLNTLTEKTNRKEYLTEFIENVDIIFSEKNLNKVEALYGKASRVAIENAIYAMKTGSNSPNQSGDGITSRWLQWVNNSIGTIMFFNRRSALLQLTSATNFLNWSDNNPAKAALAFANQPQYWKDWAMIFNSDKLKQRRSGLKSDVQESEIANAAKNTEDKIGSIIAYLLKIGFSPTQIADSIAISSGGATFYRNRVNTYKKQGLDVKEAETKAFEDMSKLSDEAQQSGDPALVSQQQRSVAGRLILSFQNTTMQYTRLMKKAGQDLINGRGDAKTHVSKILYYGALQNFIFNALSQTAFALIPGFDDDEEEDKVKRDEKLEEKASRVLNGMTDSIIRGTGIYGAVVTTIKNTYNTWEREADKGFKGDQAKTILEAANISPAIGSKLRKIYSAIQAYQFDKAVMEKHPWSVTIDGKFNPSATYSVIGNLASATLNLPLDRALAEARGVAEMFDNRNSEMQRIALALGWRTWNVGAENEEFDLIKMEAKQQKKENKAQEKADFDVYRRKVFKVLTRSENRKYSGTKGAKAKKEYILKLGEEKGIK